MPTIHFYKHAKSTQALAQLTKNPARFSTVMTTCSLPKSDSQLSAVPKSQWLPDKAVENCEGCQLAFSVFYRRHHCRFCGHIFCANCTNQVLSSTFYTPINSQTIPRTNRHTVCPRHPKKTPSNDHATHTLTHTRTHTHSHACMYIHYVYSL